MQPTQPPGDHPLIHLLVQHGVGEAAARAILTLGEQLRALTAQQGCEFAGLMDAQSGAQVAGVLGGTPGLVDVSAHINAMLPGRTYVSVHTHPLNSSFSDAGAVVLAIAPALCAATVVAVDGTWYVLSKVPGVGPASRQAITAAYAAEVWRLMSKYRRLVRPGAMTPQQARREHTHEVWQHIAGRVGLWHDRLEAP